MSAVLTVIKVILFLALSLVKFGQGLDIAPNDLAFFRRRRGLMLRSVLAVVVLMPVLALIVIALVQPIKPMAIAIAILAASPAAPFAITQVRRRGGETAYGANLQFATAALAVITTPLMLWLMAKALRFDVSVRPLDVAGQVAVAQLIPIGLGVYIAARKPHMEKTGQSLVKISTIILLAAIMLILIRFSGAFLQTGIRSYAAIVLTVLGSLALGHVLAPPDPGMQTALAIETAMRNPGLALFIAVLNFPDARPLPLLLPYVLIVSVVCAVYVKWQKKRVEVATGFGARASRA